MSHHLFVVMYYDKSNNIIERYNIQVKYQEYRMVQQITIRRDKTMDKNYKIPIGMNSTDM